ncbi:MAG: c-type cytochrome [Lautropia sp.]|nr:c-type cytochrome [Lautropia sp.]
MAGSALAQGAETEVPLKPDVKAGAETVEELCAACHGEDGNSIGPANPKLAGQHVEYLVKQLNDFKPGEDGAPAARNNAIMMGFASQLSPQDMLNVAAYYSAQKIEPAAAKDPELIELGRQIYRGGLAAKGVPACAACHGPAGDGIPAQYPALSGQFAEYTEAQLVAFRDGSRGNNGPMKDISLRMTDPEIKAVADYIAGLRNQN